MKQQAPRVRLARRTCLADGPSTDTSEYDDASKSSGSDEPLPPATAAAAALQSGGSSEASGASEQRMLYCLALVEEDAAGGSSSVVRRGGSATGSVQLPPRLRAATDDDIEQLTRLLAEGAAACGETGAGDDAGDAAAAGVIGGVCSSGSLAELLAFPPFSRTGSLDNSVMGDAAIGGSTGGSGCRSGASGSDGCDVFVAVVQNENDEANTDKADANAQDGQQQQLPGRLPDSPRTRTAAVLAAAQHPGFSPVKFGGPCMHCGVADSPQWRRGPADKPILCNACGTRFRRTNQLQSAAAMAAAKGGGAGAGGASAAAKRRPGPAMPSKLGGRDAKAIRA